MACSISGSGIIYSLHQIGLSQSDNLPIYAVKLSYNADIDEDEPRVLILGQYHAEEIYGVEIAMELIDWLLHPNTSYPVGYLDRKLGIENTELWIIPTHNPEGLLTVHGDVIGSEWVQDEWYKKISQILIQIMCSIMFMALETILMVSI